MASTINAKNTATGLVITSDSSGQLELQTLDTTKVTIATTGEVGIGMTPDGSSYLQIMAGDANHAPIELTAGTLMTNPDGGSVEYDGTAFYSSMANSTRGVMPSEQIFILNTTNLLTSQTAPQPIFDGGGLTNGAVTLPVGTYYYELSFALTGLSSTTGQFGFALGVSGGAAITYSFHSFANKAGVPSTAASAQTNWGSGASTALMSASTATGGSALIRGFIRVTTAGGIIPQVSMTVASAATISAGSYFKVSPIGNSTVTTIGNWS